MEQVVLTDSADPVFCLPAVAGKDFGACKFQSWLEGGTWASENYWIKAPPLSIHFAFVLWSATQMRAVKDFGIYKGKFCTKQQCGATLPLGHSA